MDAALEHHQKGGGGSEGAAAEVAERVHNKEAFNMLMVRAAPAAHASCMSLIDRCCPSRRLGGSCLCAGRGESAQGNPSLARGLAPCAHAAFTGWLSELPGIVLA